MKKEIWKDIKGYEGIYQVSNLGRVKRLESLVVNSIGISRKIKEKILKPAKNHTGYLRVSLSYMNKKSNFSVHRLVAQAFIPNPNGFKLVNHKDEDKTNNIVDNLEWCSAKYNSNYGNRNIKVSKKLSKKVYQYDKTKGNLIKVWSSAREVQRNLGFANSNIIKCCKGKINSAYGYVWKN